ncbi:MAG: DUF4468 domain-containing protein [Bacteroidaceae bacterium]|nr:DUF4468 domain-containing protein [Bacteroidaceae bacterium]
MKKLISILMLILIPCVSFAAKKYDMKKYGKGKVKVEEGLVVFEKEVTVDGKSKSQIHDALLGFTNQLIAQTNEAFDHYAKITMDNKEEGILVSNQAEILSFSNTKWNKDEAQMTYRIMFYYDEGKYRMRLQDFVYNYEEERNIKAEKWITDRVAISKDGKKLRKDTGKFRRLTIDRVHQLFDEAEKAVRK